MEVAVTVIDEAFLIAGIACALAIYPIIKLRSTSPEGNS
jgi:hypothetical protein